MSAWRTRGAAPVPGPGPPCPASHRHAGERWGVSSREGFRLGWVQGSSLCLWCGAVTPGAQGATGCMGPAASCLAAGLAGVSVADLCAVAQVLGGLAAGLAQQGDCSALRPVPRLQVGGPGPEHSRATRGGALGNTVSAYSVIPPVLGVCGGRALPPGASAALGAHDDGPPHLCTHDAGQSPGQEPQGAAGRPAHSGADAAAVHRSGARGALGLGWDTWG